MDLFFVNPDKEVQSYIDVYNIRYLKILSLTFGLVQFFYLFFSLYYDVPERSSYITLHAINTVLPLFLFISITLFYLKNNKKAKWVREIQGIIIVGVTATTILLSRLDFAYGGDCIVYCSIVLAITTLTLQSPFQAALYHFLAGFFYLLFWSIHIKGIDLNYTLKFLGFTLLCFASGVAKYKIFVDGIKTQLELKKVSQEFRISALTDDLTEVKNRRAFIEDCKSFAKEKSFFLFTDIDHFKKVNDLYGHQNGDYVIKYYAGVLCNLFGQNHVYRFGGDEFMVVVPHMTKQVADDALKDLQASLKNVKFDNLTHAFSVSGGYLFSKLGNTNLLIKVENTLRKLDRALYEVKNNNRGYFMQA